MAGQPQPSRSKIQRFKVQGSRFKVQGSRFKVQGSRFKVQAYPNKKQNKTMLERYVERL